MDGNGSEPAQYAWSSIVRVRLAEQKQRYIVAVAVKKQLCYSIYSLPKKVYFGQAVYILPFFVITSNKEHIYSIGFILY